MEIGLLLLMIYTVLKFSTVVISPYHQIYLIKAVNGQIPVAFCPTKIYIFPMKLLNDSP